MLAPIDDIPPFSDGLPLAPIAVISHQKLLNGDPDEAARLLDAAKTHGFFYLDLQGTPKGETLLTESLQLHALAKDVFALPLQTKLRYALERGVSLFGYKPAGTVKATDPDQRPDTTEFFNISKDYLHNTPLADTVTRGYPPEIEFQRPLLQSFTKHSHELGMLVLHTLASQLGLPPDTFTNLNLFDRPSGDHCRLTHKPPSRSSSTDTVNNTIGLPSHTDFGSVTILFNWLGGLQIESLSTTNTKGHGVEQAQERTWEWVKPLPNHAIINLGAVQESGNPTGDALTTHTNTLLKSAKHRVVPSPGAQASLDRYSVVYFVRPHNDVSMSPLPEFLPHHRNRDTRTGAEEGLSVQVAGKFSKQLALEKEDGDRVLTAGEWMRRRGVQLGN